MHSLPLCMCGIVVGTCKSGLLCIWDTQKWTFLYVWCWGSNIHTLPCVFVVLGLGHAKVGFCVFGTHKSGHLCMCGIEVGISIT